MKNITFNISKLNIQYTINTKQRDLVNWRIKLNITKNGAQRNKRMRNTNKRR